MPKAMKKPIWVGAELSAASNLVERVTRQLRGQILQGQFVVGQSLPAEARLAETFGVSRTVIRESMRELRTQGLVEVSQGRRPHVKATDSQAFADSLNLLLHRAEATVPQLMQVRRALEGETAALAARHATEVHFLKLAEAIDDCRSGTDIDACIRADVRFHQLLAEATGNPVFVLLLDTVRALLVRTQRILFPLVRISLIIDGHRRILEQVKARNPQSAREAMLMHLDDSEQALKRSEAGTQTR